MNKRLIYIIGIVFSLASCTDNDMPAATGWLAVVDVAMQQPEGVSVSTRAVDSDLVIDIKDATDAIVAHFDAAAPQAQQKIELQPGNYTLHAYNDAKPANAACYDGKATFIIHPEKTTYVSLEVPMTNAAFQLQLPQQFDTWFTFYEFSVTKDGTKHTLTAGNTLYLDIADGDELTYQLAVINADGELLSQQGSIVVAPGFSYCFTYDLRVNAVRASVM